MAFLGCILFGLIFVLMSAQNNGTLGERMNQTFTWIHAWAPFSYILIALILIAPIVSMKIIASWPKHVEPEDPMRKYRHGEDVVED